MNPEKPSREEIKAKLTVLLLGELPAEEAQLLRWAISQDAALGQLHDRLKLTVGFVREVAAHPAEAVPAQTEPLKLSGEKREKLLAHFKTVRPIIFLPPLPPKRRQFISLLEIAAVLTIVAVLAAMLLPALSSAKRKAQNISAMNLAKERALQNQEDQNSMSVLRAKAAANTLDLAIPKTSFAATATPPSASPSDESERRVAGLEAHFQNANPSGAQGALTQNVGDAWKNQTKIVLPAGGNEDKGLAAASPAPPELSSMDFSGGAVASDRNAYAVHLDFASPTEVTEALQKTFPSGNNSPGGVSQPQSDVLITRQQQMNSSSSSSTASGNANGNSGGNPFTARFGELDGNGGARGGAGAGGFGGGGRGGSSAGPVGNWQTRSTVTFSPSPVEKLRISGSARELENSTLSGEVAVNDTGAQPSDDNGRFYASTKSYSDADQKSKEPMLGDSPAAGRLFQNGPANKGFYDDNYSTTANRPAPGVGGSSPSLTVPASAANPLSAFPGNTASGGGASSDSDQFITSGLRNSPERAPVFDTTAGTRVLGDNTITYNYGNLVGTSKIDTGKFYSGQTMDVARGQLYLMATNKFENNGTIATTDAGTLVQDGKLLYEAGNVDESEAKVRQALKKDPNNEAAFYYLNLDEQARFDRDKRAQQTASQAALMPPPPVAQNSIQARLTDVGAQNQAVASSAAAPTVSPLPVAATPPPVVGEPKAKLGIDLQGGTTVTVNLDRTANLPASASAEDRPLPKTPSPAPIPQPEFLTGDNAFSTFSLNVSDVSFKLAAASLQKNVMPDAASIRSEEFINAFDYRDPEPAAGVPVAFVSERARDPFAHNRDMLRFSIKTAAAGREAGRPLNIVLLLDNSGSMERADRVAIIHEALKVLASELQPQDTLSIVTFARTARLWVDGARGDQAGTAVNQVSDLTPQGGTNLEEAMNLAYATARRHYLANGVNRVVLLTDGAANLGNVNPDALKQKVESFRKQGIALDCFGIGWEGYNDDLLEVLSSNGDGRYGFINTPEAAATEFAAQLAGALHVAAEDVKVQVEFNPQRVISWRQIGYAKHQLTKEQFRDNTVAAAPMAAREAGNALYTVEINPQGEGPVATVRVRFRIPGTTDVSEHEWEVPFDGTAPALEKSSPAMRLAATASAFSEWLAASPYAQEVTTDQLLNYLNGVPQIYGADPRPKQLETMIREAQSIAGQPSRPNRSSGGF
ncbi:MAG TPA: von Willebrand factor type A domain-containing protein [Verrucomicrobiae bacterium]